MVPYTGPVLLWAPMATLQRMREKFSWTNTEQDFWRLVPVCIHNFPTLGEWSTPLLYEPALHHTKRYDFLQLVYIKLGFSFIAAKYILKLKGNESGCYQFFAFSDNGTENAETAFIDWSYSFSVSTVLITDKRAHFGDETLQFITKEQCILHQFTLAYRSSWNSTVKRLGKGLLRVAPAVLEQFRMWLEKRPELFRIIQCVSNYAASPKRDNITTFTSFHDTKATPLITAYFWSAMTPPVTVSNVLVQRFLKFRGLVHKMAELHGLPHQKKMHQRQLGRAPPWRRKLPNFDVEGYPLVKRANLSAVEKTALRWLVPRWVTKTVSHFIHTLENLRNGAQDDIHMSRIRLFRYRELNRDFIMSHVLIW